MANRTPPAWKRDGEWRYGPTRVILSGERPGDPAQLAETAGEVSPPEPRQPRLLRQDVADVIAAAAIIATLAIIALLWPEVAKQMTPR